MRQPSSIKLKVTKFRGEQAVPGGDRSENFMGEEATPAIPRLGCLYLVSGVWGGKNYDHWIDVSRGRPFSSWHSFPARFRRMDLMLHRVFFSGSKCCLSFLYHNEAVRGNQQCLPPRKCREMPRYRSRRGVPCRSISWLVSSKSGNL